MDVKRFGKFWFLVILAAAVAGAGLIAACSSIDNDGQSNINPTDPTPGGDPAQRGEMAISPSSLTLTVGNGGTGGGVVFEFDLTGGRPPFTWSNSWPQMAQLEPYDELGLGYANRARYILRNFAGSGDDFISVRDNLGEVVTAKFTKTIEDREPLPTLAIIPSAATITSGSSISLLATGGGPYSWTTSLRPPAAGFNQGPPISQDFATGQRVTFFTEAFTGDDDRVATVTVQAKDGRTTTATITIKPTGP